MFRNIIALFCAGKPETLSLRDRALRRLLQAALVGTVTLASIFVGTIISSIIFTAIEL